MRIRTFDELLGRKMSIGLHESDVMYRFVLESIVGINVILVPADKRAMDFARAVEPKSTMRLAASVDDGMLTADIMINRWSDRSGGLRIMKPTEMMFAQRRRTVRLPARVGIDLFVHRDGAAKIISGQTEDISIGGFAATIDEAVTAGERVVARLNLPTEPIIVVAEVTLVESLRRRLAHARTLSMSPDDYAILAATLPQLEEALEKMGRMY
ncbi:MAG: PilZ domain-containing protein [Actinomycetota bacterium]|jgi:hypothetical protein